MYILDRLAKSKFRSRFKFRAKELEYFKEKGQPAILANCNEGKGINEILRATEKIKQAEMEEYAEKGRTGRKIRAMVIGIPNVRKIIIYK